MTVYKNLSIIVPNYCESNIQEFSGMLHLFYPGSQIIVSNDPYGKGKGWAIRNGLKKANREWIVFIDGDNDIPGYEIDELLRIKGDIVVGTKDWRTLPLLRKFTTLGYRALVRMLFGLKVDTQTGIKLFRVSVPSFTLDGFAFDIEILAKAQKLGYTMNELNVDCRIFRKKGFSVIWKMLKDTLHLYFLLSFPSKK